MLYKAVLLLYRVILRLGLTAGCISSPCSGWEASLLQALHVREPQQAAETATAELCWSKGEMVRLKSNRSKMSPCSMVLRPSFQLRSRIFSAWPSFTACLGFLLKEYMFQLPTKRCPSLLYRRRPFPTRMYESLSLPGTFSHGLS